MRTLRNYPLNLLEFQSIFENNFLCSQFGLLKSTSVIEVQLLLRNLTNNIKWIPSGPCSKGCFTGAKLGGEGSPMGPGQAQIWTPVFTTHSSQIIPQMDLGAYLRKSTQECLMAILMTQTRKKLLIW